ncbi:MULTISPECIES: hypothetical protein [Salimicrobium]|uniref:Tripartite tricarboxylate transporter TctB family protein n=1 Tax=Salimicrobium humidisoli TaxID=2029857 RepID=A0ABX4HSX6_9BACI|nr:MULTISPECIES: hypothetical protein [Salimicrobium]PBB05651.1 hypothetical protein CKW00_07685 [Salimicrobium humidisoli]
MVLVAGFVLLTIVSVVLGLKKGKALYLTFPFVALAGFVLVKIAMVPLPFWETVSFIFDLRD